MCLVDDQGLPEVISFISVLFEYSASGIFVSISIFGRNAFISLWSVVSVGFLHALGLGHLCFYLLIKWMFTEHLLCFSHVYSPAWDLPPYPLLWEVQVALPQLLLPCDQQVIEDPKGRHGILQELRNGLWGCLHFSCIYSKTPWQHAADGPYKQKVGCSMQTNADITLQTITT